LISSLQFTESGTTTTLAMAGGAIVSHLFYLACNQAFVSFSGVTEGYFDQITRF
jgi:hypothetical protein